MLLYLPRVEMVIVRDRMSEIGGRETDDDEYQWRWDGDNLSWKKKVDCKECSHNVSLKAEVNILKIRDSAPLPRIYEPP